MSDYPDYLTAKEVLDALRWGTHRASIVVAAREFVEAEEAWEAAGDFDSRRPSLAARRLQERRMAATDILANAIADASMARDEALDAARRRRPYPHAYVHPGRQDCRDYAECHARAYGETVPA